MNLKSVEVKLTRRLDGKGRVILPGDLREAAEFAPDEEVEIWLATVNVVNYQGPNAGLTRKPAFIITKKEEPAHEQKQAEGT